MCVTCISLRAIADQNPTEEGRWSLSGSVSFPFEYNKYRLSTFAYSIRPKVSYLPFSNFEISGGFTLASILNSSFTVPPRTQAPSQLYWGLSLGTNYFVPLESQVRPCIGVDFGFIMNKWQYKQIAWYLQLLAGITWFMNDHVALIFGVPVSWDFSSTAIFEKLTIDPGYLGIKAYF